MRKGINTHVIDSSARDCWIQWAQGAITVIVVWSCGRLECNRCEMCQCR